MSLSDHEPLRPRSAVADDAPTMTEPALSPDALSSPSAIVNPYPIYRAFRDISPVRYLRVPAGVISGRAEPLYAFAILKHADVLAVLKDPMTFSSTTTNVVGKLVPRMPLLHDDPPRHTQLRRLVSKAFNTQRVASLTGFITDVAQELTDNLEHKNAEFVSSFSVPLPMRVIASMLGIPGDEYPAFKSWTEAVIGYMGVPLEERLRRSQEMMSYFAKAIASRRENPRDDLLTALTAAEVDGASLSDEEIVRFAIVLLVAGNETTTNLIGNLIGILADRPELYANARADRSLVDPLIEETLRFESPVQRMMRLTTRKTNVGNVEIPEGEILDVSFGAANRDPAVFEDPDTFRLHRPTKEHLGFGHGTHFCLGAPLARLEAKIALNTLLDRFTSLRRPEQAAERQTMAQVSLGYRSLPLDMTL